METNKTPVKTDKLITVLETGTASSLRVHAVQVNPVVSKGEWGGGGTREAGVGGGGGAGQCFRLRWSIKWPSGRPHPHFTDL